jgi:uncharacterized protein (TIGR03437 family)
MLIALRGTGLSSTEGVEVLFDQIAAPILTARVTQLVIQAPTSIATQQSVRIDVRSATSSIGTITAIVAPAAPALFADSTGQAAATNADGELNSASHPAQRGSIATFYGTGEGIAGLPVSVTIGGFGAEVLYAGPATGYPGLLQLNVRVPSGYFAGGALPVTLIVGQAASQAGVTIAVQ